MALNEQHEQLLSRVLASRQFCYAHSLKRVLKYVCEHANSAADRPLKEYEIAVEAMGRPVSFDPKLDPVVRVSMTEIRKRLGAFFENDQYQERVRLEVPKGQYRAVFKPVQRAASEQESLQPRFSNLCRFWKKYLTSERPNAILLTEPLFFRQDGQGLYLRNLYVNDPAAGLADLRKRVREVKELCLEPCYHYFSSGEVHCVFTLTRMFEDLGSSLEMRNARLCFWSEMSSSNLILLGSSRTNSFMDSLQGGSEILITDDAIEIRKPAQKEQRHYTSDRRLDGKLRRFTEYVLISRRMGPSGDQAVTFIASNHGNAVCGAGQFLSDEKCVGDLLFQMGLGETAEIPDRFEVLLCVHMVDVDDEVVGVEYVLHRILADSKERNRANSLT